MKIVFWIMFWSFAVMVVLSAITGSTEPDRGGGGGGGNRGEFKAIVRCTEARQVFANESLNESAEICAGEWREW